MLKNIIHNKFQLGALLYFIGLIIYWIFLHHSGLKTSNYNYLYSFLFSLTPLVGGLIGMFRSAIWGRFGSAIGKTVFFFSLGLFLWGAGSMVWSWYNFFPKVAAPYPSLADIGFAPSIFFWGVGAIFLSKASGARFVLRTSWLAKILTPLLIVVLTAVGYHLLVTVALKGVIVPPGETLLRTILDIVYPLGDFIALMLSVLIFGLSFKYFGGYFKVPTISLLLGLGVMFLGDFIFSYTTTVNTFYNGDRGDLVLTTGLFLLTYGVLGFVTKPSVLPKKSEVTETKESKDS